MKLSSSSGNVPEVLNAARGNCREEEEAEEEEEEEGASDGEAGFSVGSLGRGSGLGSILFDIRLMFSGFEIFLGKKDIGV